MTKATAVNKKTTGETVIGKLVYVLRKNANTLGTIVPIEIPAPSSSKKLNLALLVMRVKKTWPAYDRKNEYKVKTNADISP
jgi:hypothetical protein